MARGATPSTEIGFPLYAFLRRSGVRPHDAEDVTQGFFLRVLSKEILHAASAEKGTLRSLLLSGLKCHLADHCRAANAGKRGGGQVTLPIEWNEAEQRYSVEPVDALDPETLSSRAWARGLFENVRSRVRSAFIASHPAKDYAAIEPHLIPDEDRAPAHLPDAAQIPRNARAGNRPHRRRSRGDSRRTRVDASGPGRAVTAARTARHGVDHALACRSGFYAIAACSEW